MEPDKRSPGAGAEPRSLSKVLGQSEHVKDLVEECAEDLSSVNTVLKHELAEQDLQPAVEDALEKNQAVATKVDKASGELTAVNRALEGEIRERRLLDHRFAAAKEQQVAAHHASFHDVLTGLPNRALFNDRLEHGFAQAKRHGWALAVLFLDLDKFKSINDLHGHEAGDRVLQAVALRLRDNTRDEDTVSRLGGDEFLYLLTEIRDEGNIALIAQKIIKAIQVPISVTVLDISLSLRIKPSVGISIYPRHGTTVDTLIISADLAMYKAKQSESGYAFAT